MKRPLLTPLKANSKGFTLLEVLVAMVILSVMFIALYYAYASNIFITRTTQTLWRVVNYTHQELLRLERGVPPPVSFNQGSFQDQDHPLYGYNWKRRVSDESPFPGLRVRKIVLEIDWEEGGNPRSHQGQAYVLPR